jgi:hypothetical protein
MTDTIHVHNITKLIFDNMQKNHKIGSLEKLKVSIDKYVANKTTKESEDDANILIYKEKYENKRIQNENMYREFVRERKFLIDKWKNENQLDALYELLKMKFEFQKVDDVYTAHYT